MPLSLICILTEDMGLFIIDTCVTRKTGQVVDHVACRRKAQTEVVDAALKEIDRISIESFSLLEKRDASTLLPLIDRNQDLLDRVLDVGHESLRRAHQICLSAGLHMKLTGAGWGGCAYALVLPGFFTVSIGLSTEV
ncbi:mevalonate kinase [Pelomyxa schiedti]|nr:mevalonate kinase [Pelomyxa schiedti]